MIDMAPACLVDGRWYVPVEDLHETLDVLQKLYEHARLIFSKPVHTWNDAIDEAYELLKANNRIDRCQAPMISSVPHVCCSWLDWNHRHG